MKRIARILLACACLGGAGRATALEADPNDVFDVISKIYQEVQILKEYLLEFDKIQPVSAPKVDIALGPGHSWQKAYEVLFKINILRQKHGLSFNAIPSREPMLKPSSMLVYEQGKRILAEIELLKYHFGIMETPPPQPAAINKNVTDNFNQLNQISYELDQLNGSTFTPSFVFAQAMRISEDINVLVEALGMTDETIPPPKQPDAKPADVFDTGIRLLGEIERVHRLAGLDVLNFSSFKPEGTIRPSEVFGLCMVILAELQPLKARLELRQALTPMANHYEGRVPGDVQQILGWSLRRMELIRAFK